MPKAGNNADHTVTHPLQAVVLADSFTRTFRPMSLEKPKVLLPIANSPMIEYTLEMLANAKVKEIFVVCCWHGDQVAEYIEKSRWGVSKSPKVKTITMPKADSAGQALRDLGDMNIIQSDPFILISGDVVSNVRLGPILRAHTERADKNQIMTMVFRKTNPGNPLRNFDDDLVIAMNADTKQLLLYEVEEGEADEDNEGEVSIKLGKDARFFVENPRLEIRYDLLDCHIDICSPELFDILKDEFYQDLRLAMVRKEVANPEFDHHFYVHELTMPQDYAARVHCIRSYDQVCKDVIGRWLYPLTPDNNWSTREGTCWFSRGFMYREQNVSLDRTAVVGRCTMLGADTTVAEGTVVESSILGRGVKVGKNCQVLHSYVWDNAIIGAGAIIDRALICDGAKIGEGAKIMRGAIISFGVVVGPNAIVLPFTRLTNADPYIDDRSVWDDASEHGFDGDDPAAEQSRMSPTEANIVRAGAKGDFQIGPESEDASNVREYTMEEEDYEAADVPEWAVRALDHATGIWKQSKSLVLGSMGCEELEKAKQSRSWFKHSSRSSRGSVGSLTGEGSALNTTRTTVRTMSHYPSAMEETLPSQVAHLFSALLAKDLSEWTEAYLSHVSMELRGLRASRESCNFEEITAVSFAVVMQTILADVKQLTPAQIKERLTEFVQSSAPLWQNFTKKVLNLETSIQVSLLQSAEMCCLVGPNLAPEVLLDIVPAEYKLEKALALSDVTPILKENASLKDFFPLILLLFATNDIVDLAALEKWQQTREQQHGSLDSHFLDVYVAHADRVKKIIATIKAQQEEEEDDDDDDDDEGEEDEE